MSGNTYESGRCNIGVDERRRRRKWAVIATFVAILWVAGIAVGRLPPPLLVAMFVPVMLAVEWFIESHTAFCVRLAARGQYRFDGVTHHIGDETDRRVDATRAIQITGSAALLAAILTGVTYLFISG